MLNTSAANARHGACNHIESATEWLPGHTKSPIEVVLRREKSGGQGSSNVLVL
jgi:hypothetical protein